MPSRPEGQGGHAVVETSHMATPSARPCHPARGKPYRSFNRESINNAAILSRAIYFVDLEMFENLYAALNNDLPACIEFFKDLETKIKSGDVEDPAEYTRSFAKR